MDRWEIGKCIANVYAGLDNKSLITIANIHDILQSKITNIYQVYQH